MSLLTIFARNAQNQATVAVRDAPGADAAANAGDDIAAQKLGGELSSTPSLSQVVAAGLLDVKAQRAYEVARQRTKRPGDRAKAREQKATSCSCGYCERRNAKAHQRPLAVSVRDLVHGREDADDASEAVAVPAQPARSFAKDDGRREVQLEDLLRVAKVRKEKAGDFEIVPNVRAVVALDDNDFEMPDIDETWEHISGAGDEKADMKAFSYAQVVAASKN